MDGEKRKRKMMENVAEGGEEEEETEEEKMESFYALIRSTKDLRDRMAAGKVAPEENKNKAGQDKRPAPAQVGVWNPSFRPEDFMELNIVNEAAAGGPSGSKDKQEEKNDENVGKEGPEDGDYDHRHNLDLNLSL